jgi:prephenate dehydrogenase
MEEKQMLTANINKMAIVGLGLIGGSLGMALTQRGFAKEVVGIDLNPEIINQGLALQAITHGTTSLVDGVTNADIVVLCAPVKEIISIARQIKPWLKKGCIVTDVGSTKEEIVRSLEEIFHPQCFFIGGHPMAGSEQSGISAADKYLLENAYYLVTPTQESNQEALKLVEEMIVAAGAKPIAISPEEHDKIVAAISHLPHIVAVSLVNGVKDLAGVSHDPLALAAGGFRDSTRIAGCNPELWLDICFTNKERILAAMQNFKSALNRLEESLVAEDKGLFITSFHQAKEAREKIPAKQKGLLPGIHQLVVTVPDKPGMIGEIAQILGEQNINIMDIEILRVREGEGGSIKLGFISREIADQALETLHYKGIIVKKI